MTTTSNPLCDVQSLGTVACQDAPRLTTASAKLDEMLGGTDEPGLASGSSLFITGVPGGGKSTLVLQLIDAVTRFNNNVNALYVSGEESKDRVAKRAQRLKIGNEFSITEEMLDADMLIDYCSDNGINFVVIDSIQKIKDGKLTSNKLITSAALKIYSMSKTMGINTVIIGQSIKSGKFAGPQAIIHEFDIHLHIMNSTEGGAKYRTFTFDKNRFGGQTFTDYEVELTNTGFHFADQINNKKIVTNEPVVNNNIGFIKKYFGALL